MTTNILLIGGGGFIGHHLAHHLKGQGHQVSIFDSFDNYGIYSDELVSNSFKERRVFLDSIPIKVGNILDKDVLDDCLTNTRATHIVFLASFPRQAAVSMNPTVATSVMTTGLVNALEVAVKHKIQKFVFISSSMVYGDFSYPIDEPEPCKPNTLYGILKKAGEDIVWQYKQTHNLPIAIVRPTAVYGPRDLPDRLIPTFFHAAMKNEPLYVNGNTEKLDFTYVGDVAQGIAAVTTAFAGQGTFNISAGTAHTIHSAAKIIVDLVGSGRVIIREKKKDMPSRNALIIAKARSLGYIPMYPLKRGLKEYWEWLKATR